MSEHDTTSYLPDVWRGPDGKPVSCVDKLKLLQENLEELREMVMGCDEGQARRVLADLVAGLEKPFAR
jgi:hypothetical protein